jgi:hypothetical protein
MRDERVYLVVDPKGNQCIARSVRVISPDEIAISHPVASDARINTRKLASLPLAFRGDLTDEKFIKTQSDWYTEGGLPDSVRVLKYSGRKVRHRSEFALDSRDDA